MGGFAYSVFAARPGSALGKTYDWRDCGLWKGPPNHNVRAVRRAVAHSLAEFIDQMFRLSASEAIGLGVCGFENAQIVRSSLQQADCSERPSLARTRDNFCWDEGEGVLFLDYDPPVDGPILGPDELVASLRSAVPELADVTIAHKASSSSWLVAPDGSQLTALKGQHLFIRVAQAAAIPILGRLITNRLWLAGFGRFDVSGSGRLLSRTLFDASVWQPERLVFVRAHCLGGVQQQPPEPRLFPGRLDELMGETLIYDGLLSAISPDEREQMQSIQEQARAQVSGQAAQIRKEWLTSRAQQIAGANAGPAEIAAMRSSMAEFLEHDVLPPQLRLLAESGETVTVAELFGDPVRWHETRFADPLEPDYRRDPRIACAFLLNTDRPSIFSHAHGGQTYWLAEPLQERRPSLLSEFDDLTRDDVSTSGNRRFQVSSAAEFASGKPIEWLIKGLLPKRAIAMIYGPSGSGKSFFALDLIWSIARGTSWRGQRTTQGRVVYVAAEGVAGVRSRFRAYASHFQIELGSVEIGVVTDTPDLRKDDYRELCVEIQRAGGASLIAIDTLAQASAGADENSAEDMARILRKCSQIIEQTGATVLLIHHSGKDEGRGARGWSGIRAAMDTEIRVGKNQSLCFAKVTKQKDGADGNEYAFELKAIDLGKDSDGDPLTSCVVCHRDADCRTVVRGKWQQRVIQVLELLDDFAIERSSLIEQVEGIAKSIGEPASLRSKEVINRAINQLHRQGVLQIDGNKISLTTMATNSHNAGSAGATINDAPHHTSL